MHVIRPSTGQLGRATHGIAPAASVGCAILIDLLWPGCIAPLMTFCAAFAWSITAPQRFSPLAAFTSGLALDLLKGWPPGLSAVLLLLLRQIAAVNIGPLRAPSTSMIWRASILVLPPVLALRWLIASGWWGHAFAPTPFLYEAATTALALPIIARILLPLQTGRPGSSHAT